MDLRIEDVAQLLDVSESTIHQWLEEGSIPAYRLRQRDEEWRFSRGEIERWLIHNGPAGMSKGAFCDEEASEDRSSHQGGHRPFALFRALHRGLVLDKVVGQEKEPFIAEVMAQVANPLDLDAIGMTDLLLDREKLEPTAIGRGIAIPHTRDFLLNRPYDLLVLAYANPPLAYGALDELPVHTLFFLFAANDRSHLHLLAKVAHFVAQPGTIEWLREQPNKKALLERMRQWEGKLLAHLQ